MTEIAADGVFAIGRSADRNDRNRIMDATWMAIAGTKQPRLWSITNPSRLKVFTCASRDVIDVDPRRANPFTAERADNMANCILSALPSTPEIAARHTRFGLSRRLGPHADLTILRMYFDTEDKANNDLYWEQETARKTVAKILNVKISTIDLTTPYANIATIPTTYVEEVGMDTISSITDRIDTMLSPMSELTLKGIDPLKDSPQTLSWPGYLDKRFARSEEAGQRLARYAELLGHMTVEVGNLPPEAPYN